MEEQERAAEAFYKWLVICFIIYDNNIPGFRMDDMVNFAEKDVKFIDEATTFIHEETKVKSLCDLDKSTSEMLMLAPLEKQFNLAYGEFSTTPIVLIFETLF